MADPTVPQVVRSYLAQLDRALAGLPGGVSEEIVAGILEELGGLDAGAAAARIEDLGDPQFIAAEARAEASPLAPPVLTSPPAEPAPTPPVAEAAGTRNSGREPGWFSILAALLFAIGGLIIPLYGWVVGLGLVWVSRSWTTGEKLAGTLIGPAAVVVGALIALSTDLSQGLIGSAGISALSAAYNAVVGQLRLLMLVNGVVGIWLAWRASRKWWPVAARVEKEDHRG
jgi:hypothetical protein